MNKLVQIFKESPRHIKWLLMAAAFLIIIILIVVLFSGDKKSNSDVPQITNAAVLNIDVPELDWTETMVGETREDTIGIGASGTVIVAGVKYPKIDGVSVKSSCEKIGKISDSNKCSVRLEYAPTSAADITKFDINIVWRGEGQPEKMNQESKILVVLSAKPAPVPEPVYIPEPQPVVIPQPEPVYIPEPEPVVIPQPEPEPMPSRSCSDFAFAGYDMNGVHMGWIKPERGSYYFYPFEDYDCKTPVGVYNADTGFIADIKDPSKRIGTDAERIGYAARSGVLPRLGDAPKRTVNRAVQLDGVAGASAGGTGTSTTIKFKQKQEKNYIPSSAKGSDVTISSLPYDRSFVLRQFKPIPATIVSEVRADPALFKNKDQVLPVRATVDRHVYADNGRTIVIPAGTLMLGNVTGDLPGPYKTIGRMNIDWYQFIRPDGVEFNFGGKRPFSADSQGRAGVPGYGSSDYMEQFIMPMLTAIVPAAVNMISPISDMFVNQIDLDNNTVTQSGQLRSSELAKNEIVTAWNRVANKLLVDMVDNTVPPFSIAAGTRITVYSPTDLIITCGDPDNPDGDKKNCMVAAPNTSGPTNPGPQNVAFNYDDGSWVGQVRSFDLNKYCEGTTGRVSATPEAIAEAGIDYRTVVAYCQSLMYVAINNAKQEAMYQNQQQQFQDSYGGVGTITPGTIAAPSQVSNQQYNQDVLGLTYDDSGAIVNPYQETPPAAPAGLLCENGLAPDGNGCCLGEIWTDMGADGFNCCPETGGDCFPPLI